MKESYLILWVLFSWTFPSNAAVDCNPLSYKFSKLNIDVQDTTYLETVMGFSYGSKVTEFIPKLAAARSNMYYVDHNRNPQVTFFQATFKSLNDAKSAFDYMGIKWKNSKFHKIKRHDRMVVWYANNKVSANCFDWVVRHEEGKIK